MNFKIYLYIMIPMLLWSTHSVFAKYILTQGVGVFEITLYKSLGAMLVFLYFFNVKKLISYPWIKWLPGVIFFVNSISFGYALKYIDAYVLMVLETSCFIFSYLLDRYLKKNVKLSAIAVIAFFIGISILLSYGTLNNNNELLIGILLAIIASVSLGFFNSTLFVIDENKDKNVLIMLPMILLSLPFALYEGSTSTVEFSNIILIVLIFGVVQTGGSIYFLTKASPYFSGTTLSIFFLLTLPGTFFVEWLFMGITFDYAVLMALFLIITSVVVNTFMVRKD